MSDIVWQGIQSVPYTREIHLKDEDGRIYTCEYSSDFDCWAIYDGHQNHPMYRLKPVAWAEI